MHVEFRGYKPVPAEGLRDIDAIVALGFPRFSWIKWADTTLSVAAEFIGPKESEEARHQIIVHNADGKGRDFKFGTTLEEGRYKIITGRLNEEQDKVFRQLVAASIRAGLVEGSRG